MTIRYAIYAAPPPDDPLWAFGSAVIGYDAATARDLPFPAEPPSNAADWPELTDDPRRLLGNVDIAKDTHQHSHRTPIFLAKHSLDLQGRKVRHDAHASP